MAIPSNEANMQRRNGAAIRVAVMIVAAAGTTGACTIDGGGRLDHAAAAGAIGTGGPCPDQVCGENSSVVDSVHFRELRFHELNLHGIPNAQGLSISTTDGIAKIFHGDTPYDLHVRDGRIIGVGDTTMLGGKALVGATIPISSEKARFNIMIRGVRQVSYAVGDSGTVDAYVLEAHGEDGSVANLCDDPDLAQLVAAQGGEGSAYAAQELLGMQVSEVLVFEGDRVDATTMTTSPDDAVDDSWINLGCASHTLAKMLLTRNTVHSQRTQMRRWEQRQATLKMLVADYCGGGIPFTVPGQSLVWQGDLVAYVRTARELEARWNENGATCLHVPRLMHPTSPRGPSTFPDVWQAIRSRCVAPALPPPPCSNLDTDNFDEEDRVSANP
jgi:hypothetical protein